MEMSLYLFSGAYCETVAKMASLSSVQRERRVKFSDRLTDSSASSYPDIKTSGYGELHELGSYLSRIWKACRDVLDKDDDDKRAQG